MKDLGPSYVSLRPRCLPLYSVRLTFADGNPNPVDDLELEMAFTRITIDPEQMGGMPCIRGLRIPVATVVGSLAEGMSETEILTAYPDLELDDIREALFYAAEALRERELPLLRPA